MKYYKTIFIDGRKLFRIFCTVFLIFLLLLSFFSMYKISKNADSSFLHIENMILDTIPSIASANNPGLNPLDDLRKTIKYITVSTIGFDLKNSESIICSQLPLISLVSSSDLSKLARNTLTPSTISPTEIPEIPQEPSEAQNMILPENQAPIKEVNLTPNKTGGTKIVLGNETSYSINIDDMLAAPPAIDMSDDGPKVLVIHTHGSESYSPTGSAIYDKTASDRTTDTEKNVVKVGEILCNILNKKGIETLHDKTLHDTPSYNGSYASSLKSMEKYLTKHPSIQVIFDIHRDSIVYSDKTKAKAVTDIDGKTAAQLMFVVGTDEKGLTHPNWRDNLKTAIHFQNAINQRYPTLMRHINLRKERFNGHTTSGSMIIETGTSGNTLTEALYGISLAADCIGDYLVSLR